MTLHDRSRLHLLASLPLFRGLGRTQLRELTRHFDQVALGPGEVLSTPGRHQAAFYVLLDGEVAISDDSGRTSRLVGGSWVGGARMLDGQASTTAAVVAVEGRALVMSRAQFRALKSHPALVQRVAGAEAVSAPAVRRQRRGGELDG